MPFKTIANGTATVSANATGLSNTVDANTTVDATINNETFRVVATVSRDLIDALQPSAARNGTQYVSLVLTIDGVDVTESLRQGNFAFARSIDRRIQTGNFSFARWGGKSSIGEKWRIGGLASGLSPINVGFTYQTPARAERYLPIVTNGIADDTTISRPGVTTESLVVADRGRRFRFVLADFKQPAGSNLSRQKMVSKIMTAVGENNQALPLGIPGKILKPVDLLRGDGIGLAQRMLDAVAWHLVWDPDGNVSAVRGSLAAPRPRPRWLFDESTVCRIVNGAPRPVTLRIPNDPWTFVELRGTAQVAAGDCGSRTVPTRSLGFVEGVRPVFKWKQSSSTGAVTNSGLTILTGSRLGSKVLGAYSFKCRDPSAEKVLEFSLYNPLRARYKKNTDGTQIAAGSGGYTSCWLRESDDDEVGHVYPRPKLIKTGLKTKSYFYKAGFLVQTTEDTWGWYARKRHIKSRASQSTAWETSTATTQYWDLGNGEAVVDREEVFRLKERVIETWQGDSDGYLQNHRKERWGWGKKPGWKYLYGNSTTSGDSEERFLQLEEEFEHYQQINEELYAYSRRLHGLDGNFLPAQFETRIGTVPSMQRLEQTKPQRSDFDTDEEFAFALAGSRYEKQDIQAECDVTDLETDLRPPRHLRQGFIEWAETVEELEELCEHMVVKGFSPELTFTVPINTGLREGDFGHIRHRHPELYLDHDIQIKELRHSGPVGGPYVTQVKALLVTDLLGG